MSKISHLVAGFIKPILNYRAVHDHLLRKSEITGYLEIVQIIQDDRLSEFFSITSGFKCIEKIYTEGHRQTGSLNTFKFEQMIVDCIMQQGARLFQLMCDEQDNISKFNKKLWEKTPLSALARGDRNYDGVKRLKEEIQSWADDELKLKSAISEISILFHVVRKRFKEIGFDVLDDHRLYLMLQIERI